MRAGGQTTVNPSGNFKCIFHGNGTRNWRKLKDRVVRDEEGSIVTNRQRDITAIRGTNYDWRCLVSFKSISKRGLGQKGFILTVKSLAHSSHQLSPKNPLVFLGYRYKLEEFQAVKAQARLHRMAIIPYSISRRVLVTKEAGFLLKRKEFYNSVRYGVLDGTNKKIIKGLLTALDEY